MNQKTWITSPDGMSTYRKSSYLSEQQRITKFAPRVFCKGPHIRDFELLSRTILYPDHTHSNGELKEEAISRQDITSRGFSVFRVKYTELDVVVDIVDRQIAKMPERNLVGASTFLAGSVRSITDKCTTDKGNYQSFVIIDDADTLELRGHALILCAEKYKPSRVKEFRRNLLNLLHPILPLEEVFAP